MRWFSAYLLCLWTLGLAGCAGSGPGRLPVKDAANRSPAKAVPKSTDTSKVNDIVEHRFLKAILRLPFGDVDRILRHEFSERDEEMIFRPIPEQPALRGYLVASSTGRVSGPPDARVVVQHEAVQEGQCTVIRIKHFSKLAFRETVFRITALDAGRTRVSVDIRDSGLAFSIDWLYEQARLSEIIELLRRETAAARK